MTQPRAGIDVRRASDAGQLLRGVIRFIGDAPAGQEHSDAVRRRRSPMPTHQRQRFVPANAREATLTAPPEQRVRHAAQLVQRFVRELLEPAHIAQ